VDAGQVYVQHDHVGFEPLHRRQQCAAICDRAHDLARFLFAYRELNETDEGAIEALRSALFFLFTWDGIPCIYYGTEQGFHGGVDPGNREDMVFDHGPAQRDFG
jgi:glycosidase